MQIRPGNGAVALTAGLALAVLLGPLIVRDDPAEAARLDVNRKAIADMTEANRQKLLKNFDRWEKMTPDEQRRWRTFAQQLEDNRASLGPVVQDYYDWLQTIPGYRRDELRRAPDVQQKVSLVKEIAQEQLAERLEAPDVTSIGLGGREVPVLTSAELDDVFAALESGLSSADQAKLVDRQGNELEGVERHLMLLGQLVRFGGLRQMIDSPGQRSKVEAALPARITELLESLSDRKFAPMRGNLLSVMLMMSVRLELERAFQSQRPGPEELRRFYDKDIPPAEQEQLLNLSADDFVDELTRRYYRSQLVQKTNIDLEKVERFLNFIGGPPGNQPPGDRGPGQRYRPQLGGGGPFFPRDGARRPGEEGPGGDPRRPPPNDRPPPREGDPPPPPGDRPR